MVRGTKFTARGPRTNLGLPHSNGSETEPSTSWLRRLPSPGAPQPSSVNNWNRRGLLRCSTALDLGRSLMPPRLTSGRNPMKKAKWRPAPDVTRLANLWEPPSSPQKGRRRQSCCFGVGTAAGDTADTDRHCRRRNPWRPTREWCQKTETRRVKAADDNGRH